MSTDQYIMHMACFSRIAIVLRCICYVGYFCRFAFNKVLQCKIATWSAGTDKRLSNHIWSF